MQAAFQGEDEHHFMDLSVFLPARDCSTVLVQDMLMRGNICRLDEGGNWRIFSPDKQLNSQADGVRGLI